MVKRRKTAANAIPLIKWAGSATLPLAELFLIGWIVWFAFPTEDGLAKETQNLLSAIVGGLIVNYTKMSGYIFSRESDETKDE